MKFTHTLAILILCVAFAGMACGDSQSESQRSGDRWSTDEPSNNENNANAADAGMGEDDGVIDPPVVDMNPSNECRNDDGCPEGFSCQDDGTRLVCVEAAGVADGEACGQDGDCAGGTCVEDWPDGYCTTVGCTDFNDCARQGNDNRCLQNSRGDNYCVRICEEDSECRPGYFCQALTRRQGACFPDPRSALDPTADTPFEVQCIDQSGPISFEFEVAEDTSAYMVTPFSPGNRYFRPDQINLPSGAVVDFQTNPNGFQATPAFIYGGLNPTVIPATPQFTSQVESGLHSYDLFAEGDQTCWYMIEETAPGSSIDLNLYFVDLNGLSAATAPMDEDMQQVLQSFDAIYQPAGYTIGKVRYFDVDPQIAPQFGVLRDENAISALVALSESPGPTKDDVLSVNVFFVRAIAGSALGISLGLPGPAGWHGSSGSGVVFTAQYIGDESTRDGFGNTVSGNDLTAQIMAHEVGHYLGLFHTSEQTGRSHDPLTDTAECYNLSGDCPDIGNLMFPFAASVNVTVSNEQAFVMGSNPLTKTPIGGDPTPDPDPDMGQDMNLDMGTTTDMGTDGGTP